MLTFRGFILTFKGYIFTFGDRILTIEFVSLRLGVEFSRFGSCIFTVRG